MSEEKIAPPIFNTELHPLHEEAVHLPGQKVITAFPEDKSGSKEKDEIEDCRLDSLEIIDPCGALHHHY